MSFKTISAILRGDWLLSPEYVQQHTALLVNMLNGDFAALQDDRDENAGITEIAHAAAGAPAVYKVRPYTAASDLPAGSIAVIDIIGPVTKYGGMCSFGSADHAATLNRMASAPNVAGIILNIDSPGGQVSGTSMLADAITAAKTKKPVVAFVDDGMAASAAMWFGSAASELFITKNSAVGSIGVFTTLMDLYGYAEKMGLKVRDIYAPESSDKNGEHREALKGNDEPIKARLSEIATNFHSTIKGNRAGKLTSDEWKTGKMFNAKDAQRIGLIDGVKSFDQVISRTNQLIQTKNKKMENNAIAFAAIMAVAGITEIAVTDNGFVLQENDLNAINAALENNASVVEGLNNTIAERDASITALQERITALESADQAATVAAQATQITELTEKIATLEKKPAANFTSTNKPADDLATAGKNKYHTKYDDEAAAIREARGEA
jgi:protease IV